MTEESNQLDNKSAPDTMNPSHRFWALPWWGWAITSFGGVTFLSGLSVIVQVVQGNGLSSEEPSMLFAISLVLLMLVMLGCGFVAFLKLVAKLIGYRLPASPAKPWFAIGAGLFTVSMFMPVVAIIMIAASIEPPEASLPSEEPAFVTHNFGEGAFGVTVPGDWSVVNDPSLVTGTLFLSDQPNDLHLMALATPLEDYSITSIDQLLDHWAMNTAQSITNPIAGEPRIISAGNIAIADTTVTGAIDDTNIVFRLRLIKTKTHWIEIKVWATPSKSRKHGELFEDILASVTESS